MEKNNCISKCFPAKTAVLHPLYLKPITSNKPYCLVNNNNYYEKCDNSSIDIDIDYFVPKINMSEKLILKNIYNINSWSDTLDYIKKNRNESYITISRILNLSWVPFYKSSKNDIDIIINCYKMFFQKTKKEINIEKISKILYSITKNLKKYESKNIHMIIESS